MPEVTSDTPSKVPKTKLPLWWVGATASRTMTMTKVPTMCHTEEKPFKRAASFVPMVFRSP